MPVVIEGVPQGSGWSPSVLGLASWPGRGLGMAAELREPSSPPRDLLVAWVCDGVRGRRYLWAPRVPGRVGRLALPSSSCAQPVSSQAAKWVDNFSNSS